MRIFSPFRHTRIFLLRRRTAALFLCLLGAAAIFTAVSIPYAAVSASAVKLCRDGYVGPFCHEPRPLDAAC